MKIHDSDVFMCDFCPYTTMNEDMLQHHSQTHNRRLVTASATNSSSTSSQGASAIVTSEPERGTNNTNSSESGGQTAEPEPESILPHQDTYGDTLDVKDVVPLTHFETDGNSVTTKEMSTSLAEEKSLIQRINEMTDNASTSNSAAASNPLSILPDKSSLDDQYSQHSINDQSGDSSNNDESTAIRNKKKRKKSDQPSKWREDSQTAVSSNIYSNNTSQVQDESVVSNIATGGFLIQPKQERFDDMTMPTSMEVPTHSDALNTHQQQQLHASYGSTKITQQHYAEQQQHHLISTNKSSQEQQHNSLPIGIVDYPYANNSTGNRLRIDGYNGSIVPSLVTSLPYSMPASSGSSMINSSGVLMPQQQQQHPAMSIHHNNGSSIVYATATGGCGGYSNNSSHMAQHVVTTPQPHASANNSMQ